MLNFNKKLLFLIVFVGLIVVPLVIAPGPGPAPTPVPKAFVVDTPTGVGALQSNDVTIDLTLVGTAEATKTALLTKTSSGTEYPVMELVIDYTTNEESEDNVTNVSIEDVVIDLDLTNNKVLATSPGTAAVSALTKMYISKVSGANVIVVCDGATSLAQVGEGCGSNSGVTEEMIRLGGGYTGRYTVNSYSFGGKNYWEVSGVTGTGLQIFSLDFGGGDGLDFAVEEEIIDLDGVDSRSVISREGIGYYILYEGEKYKALVRSVNVKNGFASIYVEGKDNIIPVDVGDSVELDLNQDGEIDIVLYVENIKYPDVYLTIALYSEGFTFEPRDQTEAIKERGAMFGSGDLWSRFVGDEEGDKIVVFIYLVVGLIFVGFLVLFGSKLIGRIWQAT